MNAPYRVRIAATAGILAAALACASEEETPPLPTLKALSPEGARDFQFSFALDGKRIAWWAPREDSVGGYQLWIANADLTGRRMLPVVAIFTNPPAWSPDGTRIAANTREYGLSHIVVVPVTGGPPKRVTFGANARFTLGWHPDGDRLLSYDFAEGGSFRVAVTSTRTGAVTQLIPGEARPTFGNWSPDGSRIAYMVFEGAKTTLWIADSTGQNRRQLTFEGFEQLPNMTAGWSPDGKQLVYESRRTGKPDIWVIPVDGGSPRQLTRDIRSDYSPVWSSDGKYIAFLSNRGGQTDVWVVSSAGGTEFRVTDTPADKDDIPAWRPGTYELLLGATTRRSSLWRYDLATGAETRLTPDSLRVNWFQVSPDGRQVNFSIHRGGDIEDLAVIPASGGDIRTLVTGGGSVRTARWSPDGAKIAFASNRAGTADIWMVDVATGGLRQVDTASSVESQPSWSADGTLLYYISNRDARISDLWAVPVTGGAPKRVTSTGNVIAVFPVVGFGRVLLGVIGTRAGEYNVALLGKDRSLRTINDQNASVASEQAYTARGDSVLLWSTPPGVKGTRIVLAPLNRRPGRPVLPANTPTFGFSPDGRTIGYFSFSAGKQDLALLNPDGSTRRLTSTPEDEDDASWLPDGKSILFRRTTTVQRMFTADLSKLLAKQ